eukprot:2565339-Pyramimonas_sp.AAC.1
MAKARVAARARLARSNSMSSGSKREQLQPSDQPRGEHAVHGVLPSATVVGTTAALITSTEPW